MKTVFRVMLVFALVFGAVSIAAAETLNGAGASFPYPVYSAWAYNYHKATGVQINYQSIGSGGGIRQISNRTVDFGASDAPQTPDFLKEHNLLQFPAVMGGVVLVVNIHGVKAGQMRLDADTVGKIFLGDITYWDDPAIKAMNPKLQLPHKYITVVHRSDGSGTTAIFTSYLSGACPAWKDRVGHGTSVSWPTGIGGKGNEGVSNYVQRAGNSIGYVEFAYAKQNHLAYTLLKNPAGHFVAPKASTFMDAAATGDFEPQKDFYLWLVNAKGKNAWPIAGATFILLAKDKMQSSKNTVKFYNWAFKHGNKTAEKLIYIPLPDSLKNKIRTYWKAHGLY